MRGMETKRAHTPMHMAPRPAALGADVPPSPRAAVRRLRAGLRDYRRFVAAVLGGPAASWARRLVGDACALLTLLDVLGVL